MHLYMHIAAYISIYAQTTMQKDGTKCIYIYIYIYIYIFKWLYASKYWYIWLHIAIYT